MNPILSRDFLTKFIMHLVAIEIVNIVEFWYEKNINKENYLKPVILSSSAFVVNSVYKDDFHGLNAHTAGYGFTLLLYCEGDLAFHGGALLAMSGLLNEIMRDDIPPGQ